MRLGRAEAGILAAAGIATVSSLSGVTSPQPSLTHTMAVRRRLRGMLGTALMWGAGFGVLHLTLVTLQYGGTPAARDTAVRLAVWGTLAWAILGALGGLAFGALVVALERRRTLATLSRGRFALMGLLAGATLTLLPFGAYALVGGMVGAAALLVVGGTGAALGGGIASASLWLARRAARVELGTARAATLPPVT